MKLKLAVCALALQAMCAYGTVVNVNARVSGSQPGPNQAFWHDPFNAVSLSLSAGTHTFQIVDPILDNSAQFTAWTFNAPFITNYLVFLSTDLTHEFFDGAVSDNIFRGTAQSAFDATVAAGHDKATLTFATPVTLLFAVPDNILSDNQGGVSISVDAPVGTATTPEPASFVLLASGLCAAVMGLRRRRKGAHLGNS